MRELAKVVLVVIDGVRRSEWEGKARTDDGRLVPPEDLFPNLTSLRAEGAHLSSLAVSNPVGISLPAYADIFAGRRQERFLDNRPNGDWRSEYPTIFEVAHAAFSGASDAVALFSSWTRLAELALSKPGPAFYRSVLGLSQPHFKPEVYPGSRSDMDTFVHFMAEVPRRRPRFAFVHFGDADEEGHLHGDVARDRGCELGIFHYHQALRAADYYIGRMWRLLQTDPYYRDSTYLMVTTDHGRDEGEWWDHGACVAQGKPLCPGCGEVFAVVAGPGVKGEIATPYSHIDIAPTVARWLGIEMPSAMGRPILELIP